MKIADLFNVSTDYLLGRPGAKPPESPIEAMEREKKLKSLEKRLIKEYLELPEKQREAVIAFMDKIIAEEAAERGFVLQPDGTYVKAPDTDVTSKISADSVPDKTNIMPSAAEPKDKYHDLLKKSGAEMTDEEIELTAELYKKGLREEKEAAEKSSASSGFTATNTQNDIENRKEA